MLCLLLLILATLELALCQRDVFGHPVVTTVYGKVRGNRTAIGDNSYVDVYYDIPYAKPPTGDLRFRRPQPPDAWTSQGVLDATGAHRYQCPQGPWFSLIPLTETFSDSEACLNLDIYTPEASGNTPLPVMFWIHGGGMYVGTGHTYDGTQLAGRGVVVVTINYRLDALGFLSTEDAASPGNYGLWDMLRALEWVRDSISAFNGNPNDVTIFGESDGGVAVSLLVESKAAAGLFHKAIMESGVSLIRGSTDNPRIAPAPRVNARQLGERMDCPHSDTTRMLSCLRTKNANLFLDAASGLGFRPVPETTFGLTGALSADPIVVMEQGTFNNVTTIRGCNHDDSSLWLIPYDREDDGFTMNEITTFVDEDVQGFFSQSGLQVDTHEVASQLMNLYFSNITDPKLLRAAYAEMYNDMSYWVPAILETQIASKFPVKPQYVYRFSYRSTNRLTPQWTGTAHTDELEFVFGSPFSDQNIFGNSVSSWTEADRQVSETVMTLWTNFAKYGDPTPGAGINGVKWLPWTQNRQGILDITEQLHMRYDLMTPKETFWMEKLQAVLRGRSGVLTPGIIG